MAISWLLVFSVGSSHCHTQKWMMRLYVLPLYNFYAMKVLPSHTVNSITSRVQLLITIWKTLFMASNNSLKPNLSKKTLLNISMRRTTQNDGSHHWEKCIWCLLSLFYHVYDQGAGFRNYSAPEGKQDIWVLFWGAVMSRIFIYSQWFNPENTVMKLNIAFHYSLRWWCRLSVLLSSSPS